VPPLSRGKNFAGLFTLVCLLHLSALFTLNRLSRRAVHRSRRDTRLLDDELHPLLQETALRLRQRRGKRQLAAGRIRFLPINNHWSPTIVTFPCFIEKEKEERKRERKRERERERWRTRGDFTRLRNTRISSGARVIGAIRLSRLFMTRIKSRVDRVLNVV